MLIRRDDITFDGLTCNKVGVSYEAFQHESGKCENSPGSCLRNQLEDFHEAGKNFLDDYGTLGLAEDSVNGQIYLSFEAETTQTSLVTLTMDASDVKFVINVSHGKFVSCDVADFESMSREGIVTCSVRNEGKVKADFHVSITKCSNGIMPILGQTKTIDNTANTTAQFIFDVRSENILDSAHFCMAYLYDSLYEVNDELQIHFTSTVQVEEKGAQGGISEAKLGKAVKGDGVKYKCKDKCGYLDLMCLFLEGCYEDIGLIILFAVLIFCGLPFLIKMIWRCWKNRMDSSTKKSRRYEYHSHENRRRKRRHRKINRNREEDSESTSDSANHESNRRERRRKRKHYHSPSSAKKHGSRRHRVKKRRAEHSGSDGATSKDHKRKETRCNKKKNICLEASNITSPKKRDGERRKDKRLQNDFRGNNCQIDGKKSSKRKKHRKKRLNGNDHTEMGDREAQTSRRNARKEGDTKQFHAIAEC